MSSLDDDTRGTEALELMNDLCQCWAPCLKLFSMIEWCHNCAGATAKRKRPRVRTRTEEGGIAQSKTAPSLASGPTQVKDADQITSRPSTAERSGVKVEGSGTETAGEVASSTTVIGTVNSTPSAVPSSGTSAIMPAAPITGAVGGPAARDDKNLVEKKGMYSEKKMSSSGGKVETASSNSGERRITSSPVREKKTVSGEVAGSAAIPAAKVKVDAEPVPSASAGAGAVATKMEVEKRYNFG